ncbi:MAG: hypothetical protein KA205_03300, partial [Acidobacteria bacterium]|nr:hypothetical protein [Acidobacteriota bacterium]
MATNRSTADGAGGAVSAAAAAAALRDGDNAGFLVSDLISSALTARTSPGRNVPTFSEPMRVRVSCTTGCPIAS